MEFFPLSESQSEGLYYPIEGWHCEVIKKGKRKHGPETIKKIIEYLGTRVSQNEFFPLRQRTPDSFAAVNLISVKPFG